MDANKPATSLAMIPKVSIVSRECIYKTPLEIPLAKNSTLLSAILKCIDCTTVADVLGSTC